LGLLNMVFFILGIVLLGISVWGWIGFFIVVRMKESFNIATPSEFLSMSVIGIGLIITYWVSWLGWLLVLIRMLAGFILFRVPRFITQKRKNLQDSYIRKF